MLPYYSENWVTGEVFPSEMLSLLYIASVKSLNAIQPLVIELLSKRFSILCSQHCGTVRSNTNL